MPAGAPELRHGDGQFTTAHATRTPPAWAPCTTRTPMPCPCHVFGHHASLIAPCYRASLIAPCYHASITITRGSGVMQLNRDVQSHSPLNRWGRYISINFYRSTLPTCPGRRRCRHTSMPGSRPSTPKVRYSAATHLFRAEQVIVPSAGFQRCWVPPHTPAVSQWPLEYYIYFRIHLYFEYFVPRSGNGENGTKMASTC